MSINIEQVPATKIKSKFLMFCTEDGSPKDELRFFSRNVFYPPKKIHDVQTRYGPIYRKKKRA